MIKNPSQLKDFILELLDDKKANDIIVIDLGNKNELANYIILATGTSIKNIGSIAEYICLELKHKTNYKIIIEGLGKSDWVLVDIGDVIIHLFHPVMRAHLKLEEKYK